MKRHKRQVSRARERVRAFEPDLQNAGTIEGSPRSEPPRWGAWYAVAGALLYAVQCG